MGMVLIMISVLMSAPGTLRAQDYEYGLYTRFSEVIADAEAALGAGYNACMMSQELEERTDTEVCTQFDAMLKLQVDVVVRAHQALLKEIDPRAP